MAKKGPLEHLLTAGSDSPRPGSPSSPNYAYIKVATTPGGPVTAKLSPSEKRQRHEQFLKSVLSEDGKKILGIKTPHLVIAGHGSGGWAADEDGKAVVHHDPHILLGVHAENAPKLAKQLGGAFAQDGAGWEYRAESGEGAHGYAVTYRPGSEGLNKSHIDAIQHELRHSPDVSVESSGPGAAHFMLYGHENTDDLPVHLDAIHSAIRRLGKADPATFDSDPSRFSLHSIRSGYADTTAADHAPELDGLRNAHRRVYGDLLLGNQEQAATPKVSG